MSENATIFPNIYFVEKRGAIHTQISTDNFGFSVKNMSGRVPVYSTILFDLSVLIREKL